MEELWKWFEKKVYYIFSFFYKIANKEMTENTFQIYIQFIKFGIVGVSNTIIYYIIYLISYLFMQYYHLFLEIDYLIAQVIAYILSVLWSYYWNNKMVFKADESVQRNWWKTLIKTYIAYSFTGLFLNSILIVVWVKLFHVLELFAPILNLLINVPINFLINKFWAFN